MPAPLDTSHKPKATKADKELLFKGVTLALIGLVILLAPYVARSTSVRDLMGQVALVGWFALVLGIAFGVQYGLRRAKAGRRQPCPCLRRQPRPRRWTVPRRKPCSRCCSSARLRVASKRSVMPSSSQRRIDTTVSAGTAASRAASATLRMTLSMASLEYTLP